MKVIILLFLLMCLIEKILNRRLETRKEISTFRKKRSQESVDNIFKSETEENPKDPKFQEMAKEVVYEHIRLKKENIKNINVFKIIKQISGVKIQQQFKIILKNGKQIVCSSAIQERFDLQAKDVSYVCNQETTTTTTTATPRTRTKTNEEKRSPTTETNNNCRKEGYKWEARTSSCYKYYDTIETWDSAYKICQTEGGHLAIINSDTESQVLKEIFQSDLSDNECDDDKCYLESYDLEFALVGFCKADTENEWETINGDTLEAAGFDKWAEFEPNNWDERENCGSIKVNGLLNDVPCDWPFPYICEFTP